MKLDQAQILEAIVEYLVRHKHVQGGSAVDIRLRVVDDDGEPVGILVMGDQNPVFEALVTDFGIPTPD